MFLVLQRNINVEESEVYGIFELILVQFWIGIGSSARGFLKKLIIFHMLYSFLLLIFRSLLPTILRSTVDLLEYGIPSITIQFLLRFKLTSFIFFTSGCRVAEKFRSDFHLFTVVKRRVFTIKLLASTKKIDHNCLLPKVLYCNV